MAFPRQLSFVGLLLVSGGLHVLVAVLWASPEQEITPPTFTVQIGFASVDSRASVQTQTKSNDADRSNLPEAPVEPKPPKLPEPTKETVAPPKPASKDVAKAETTDAAPSVVATAPIVASRAATLRFSSVTFDNPLPEAKPLPPDEKPVLRPTASPKNSVQVTQAKEDVSAKPGSLNSQASRGAKFDQLPQKLVNPDPKYPDELLARRIEGTVTLRVAISAEGRVTAISVYKTSGFAAFDESALKTVRHWRFVPARRGKTAVPWEGQVPLQFEIGRR